MDRRREEILFKAAHDVMKEREAKKSADFGRMISEHLAFVQSRAPQPVTVNVDMTPVAAAIDQLTAVVTALGKMMEQLAEALVRAQGTATGAAGATAPPRGPRTLRIRHDDGTESVVTEEPSSAGATPKTADCSAADPGGLLATLKSMGAIRGR